MKHFDRTAEAEGKPLIEPKKKTTKLNIAMISALLLFLAVGVGMISSMD